MRILAIDTATEACSVALFENNKLVAGDYQEIGRGHAERLVPMIASLPDKGRADHILVNCGPGSFTGVRIGISAAKALAFAWSSELAGYQSLHFSAQIGLKNIDDAGTVRVAMQGGHGELFTQTFSGSGAPLTALQNLPIVVAIEEMTEEHIIGSAADLVVSERGYGHAQNILPDAREILLLSDQEALLAPSPIYGREPDAKPATSP